MSCFTVDCLLNGNEYPPQVHWQRSETKRTRKDGALSRISKIKDWEERKNQERKKKIKDLRYSMSLYRVGRSTQRKREAQSVRGFSTRNWSRERHDTSDIWNSMRSREGVVLSSMSECSGQSNRSIRSVREWRAVVGREARRDSWLHRCVVRDGIVSAFVDAPQSHLQIGRTTSHTRTETGCCPWVSWLMDGPTLLGGSNDRGAEEVRVGLWLSDGMKTVVLSVLCLVDKTTVFHLILLIIDWLRLVGGLNGSKNWIHILSPDLFWNVQRVHWVCFVFEAIMPI